MILVSDKLKSNDHDYEYVDSHTEQLHTSDVCTGRGG